MSFIQDTKQAMGLLQLHEPCFRAVLFGEECAYFENVNSIKSFSQNKIEITLKKGQLKLEGENLFIKKYCGGDLVVCGKIKSLLKQ